MHDGIHVHKQQDDRDLRKDHKLGSTDNMANRKKTMSPLQKESGVAIILVADHGVYFPIGVTGE